MPPPPHISAREEETPGLDLLEHAPPKKRSRPPISISFLRFDLLGRQRRIFRSGARTLSPNFSGLLSNLFFVLLHLCVASRRREDEGQYGSVASLAS